METFSHRESVLLGYIPQKAIINSSSSLKNPRRNSDIDFNDVFGGPPRRSSMQEVRYSFNEAADSYASCYSLNGLSEKPVFGEEGANQGRYPSDNFFDDIFRGNESLSSSPRNHYRDPFASAPGSRVLSPARPLPPKAEPFGSSLPARFSLYKNKDEASNGASYHSYSPLSRSSYQANQGPEELRNGVQSSSLQSLLSQELSLGNEESSNLNKNDRIDMGGNSKEDSINSEVSNNGSQFHFSIYRWGSKEVPVVVSLRRANGLRFKESAKIERCSSSNENIASERMVEELPIVTSLDADFSSNDRTSKNMKALEMELEKQENRSPLDTRSQNREPCKISEETILPISELETLSSVPGAAKDVPVGTIPCDTGEKTKSHSLPKIGLCCRQEKEFSVITSEAHKPDLKSFLLYNNDDEQGKDEMTRKDASKESKMKSSKKSSVNLDVSKRIKKPDGKRTYLDSGEARKATIQDSTMKSGNPGRKRVKEKVKELVKFFNQETSVKTNIDVESQSQRSRLKARGAIRADNATGISKTRTDETVHMPNEQKKKPLPDAPLMVDEYYQPSEKQDSSIKNTNHMSNGASGQKDSSESSAAPISDGAKAIDGNIDESFQVDFIIKELTQDENKLPQASYDLKEMQVIDAKIRKWSSGKEGNIRSLLSTLQYVLWPESGWKPVPLADIIEGNAVKKSYQRALLCLHPDKLQQKGAASHQKYIAEKVFDILQEAWTHFNSLGSF